MSILGFSWCIAAVSAINLCSDVVLCGFNIFVRKE